MALGMQQMLSSAAIDELEKPIYCTLRIMHVSSFIQKVCVCVCVCGVCVCVCVILLSIAIFEFVV